MNNNKTGDQQKNRKFIFLVATVFFIGLFSTSVFAADPGHGAGVIGSMDFESGNYSFPDKTIQKRTNVLNIEHIFEKSKDIKIGECP